MLAELHTLLTYDRKEFHVHMQAWRKLARANLTYQLHWFRCAEQAIFGPWSFFADGHDVEADINSDVESDTDMSTSSDSQLSSSVDSDSVFDEQNSEDGGDEDSGEEDLIGKQGESSVVHTDIARKRSREETRGSDVQPAKRSRARKLRYGAAPAQIPFSTDIFGLANLPFVNQCPE